MGALEVFTIGGGEFIVNVLNAVAAWCGGGGYRSMLQVVMVMGLTYSLFVVAFSLDWRAWFNGSVRNFVCGRAAEHYAAMALMKRSPKMTANCALAMVHSRGGILHSFSDRFKIR